MRPRRLVLVRGDAPVEVASGAEVLFAGGPGELTARDVEQRLGSACDAVVLDLRPGLDADVLGQVQGFVRGGGALVLRVPEDLRAPPCAALAVNPFSPGDVGDRFWRRLVSHLPAPSDAPVVLGPADRAEGGSGEQAAVVGRLSEVLRGPAGGMAVLLSDRGRGKSAALGLAARELPGVVVTAAQAQSAAEVLRFASPDLRFVEPRALIGPEAPDLDILLVDEAAQLPVPLLQRLVLRHPDARIAFATTTRGYEGTGRGFVLRFLEWARALARPLTELSLEMPIRWPPGDPLERQILHALALDAEPARVEFPTAVELSEITHEIVDRETLAADEASLRALFGLLVHAHYRTTPSDLHRALDAPNLVLHALRWRGQVVAASLLALEGGLPPSLCQDMAAGRTRIRGHALADTLVTHAGEPGAGELSIVRSVRIATHPALRRLGLARRLVEAIHATHAPDLFGTVFGATPELLHFRRAVGYELVRVGVSRGARSGEPAAVMIHPVSEAARALVGRLRDELARALPVQLALQAADGDLVLDPDLDAALRDATPPAPPPDTDPAAENRAVTCYLETPQPFEPAAWAVVPWVRARLDAWAALPAQPRALIQHRVLNGASWPAAARAAGYPSTAAAMRALRPALRRLNSPPSASSPSGPAEP